MLRVELSETASTTWKLIFCDRKTLVDAATERGLVGNTLSTHICAGIDKGLLCALQCPNALPGAVSPNARVRRSHQSMYANFDDIANDIIHRLSVTVRVG